MSYPFSDVIPELLQKHYNHLIGSAIAPEVIRELGYRSILGKKELGDLGFPRAQQRCLGVLISLHSVDGNIVSYQYKPDNPRTGAKGRKIKYANPIGSSIRLDVSLRYREKLGGKISVVDNAQHTSASEKAVESLKGELADGCQN